MERVKHAVSKKTAERASSAWYEWPLDFPITDIDSVLMYHMFIRSIFNQRLVSLHCVVKTTKSQTRCISVSSICCCQISVKCMHFCLLYAKLVGTQTLRTKFNCVSERGGAQTCTQQVPLKNLSVIQTEVFRNFDPYRYPES